MLNFQFNTAMFFYLLEIVLSVLIPKVQSLMTKEQTLTIVSVYVALLIIKEWTSTEYNKAISFIGLKKAKEFHLKTLEKYKTLSQADRESESIHVFLDVLDGMKSVIQMENSWFKITWKTLVSMLITTITTIIVIKSWTPIIYITLCYSSFYWFIKQHMIKMKKDREYSKHMNKRSSQQNRLEYSKLRLGEGNINDIVKREYESEQTYHQRDKNWQTMSILTTLPLLMALMMTVVSMNFVSNTKTENNSLDIIMFFLTLFQNIHHITGFMGQYENMKTKKDKFNDYWKGKTFTPLPAQQDIDDFTISEYSYKGSGKLLTFNRLASIAKGDIVRLTGSTGAGKTTFVDSLKGVVKGLKLKTGINPMCFLTKISHMRQDIRDSIPFNEVSIKDLFYQRKENLIREILCVVGLENWLNGIMENNLDKKINNQISGGQKTLFCLALTLVDAIDKQMLILDEPEQGLDSELVPETLEKTFKWLKSKNPSLRIIFISHLCKCVVERLPKHIHWHIERNTEEDIFSLSVC